MRKTALLFVIAVYGYAANAQLTLRPQFGFESPLTKISYNNSSYYKAVCQSLPQAGVRADYQLKKGFAPFLGIFTHRPLVNYTFNEPATGMAAYHATNGDLQMQLQAGLQYSIKPIALGKKIAAPKPQKVSEPHGDCYHSYRGGCPKKSGEALNTKQQISAWTMRLQPSIGFGYVPSAKQNIKTRNSGAISDYTYNAGNIKTELVTGLGFEFAKNNKRFLTLSVNYFKGLATNETLLNTESAGKPLTTNLRSKLSGWNAAIGIPISFTKKGTTTTATKTQNNCRHSCSEYYKKRCGSYRRI